VDDGVGTVRVCASRIMLHGTGPPFRGHLLALGVNVPGARETAPGLRDVGEKSHGRVVVSGRSLKCHHCRFGIPALGFSLHGQEPVSPCSR
jgi:hypothetical protein